MKKSIKVGSQFSGVGAFEQSLIRLGIDFKNIYAADWDKYARQTYLLNFEKPEYYVKDVHDTPIKEITEKHGSLDIAMFSPPCQAFSLAGKRLGKEDKRGILFFNSLEFIQENKPRYFIFENVKGLLSHDKQDKNAEYGRTFQEWINYLGGKSVNGVHTFFPYEDSVPYHIYFQVLNAKHYGIPQNRERIFIIGIRDDEDNNFHFPKPFPLEKRLKDVLETEVDEKYFLSDKMIDGLINTDHLNSNRINNAIRVGGQGSLTKKHSFDVVKVGHINQDTQASQVFSEDGTSPSICAGTHGYALGYVETQIGTWRTHEDGRGFRATEDNNCPTIPARAREDGSGQPVIKVNEPSILGYTRDAKGKVISRHEKDISGTIHTASGGGGNTDQFVKIGAIRGRNPENPKRRQSGLETEQMLEINENGTSNALTTVQKDNVVVVSEILKSIDNEKRNTAKVLLMLQQEIGKKAVETWRLRILEIIREKDLLQQRVHEKSIQEQGKENTRKHNNKNKQAQSSIIVAKIIMRSLPKEGWERCSSQRRKSIKQLVRELNESLQKLPHENPQTNINLQIGELRYESERIRVLRETLSKIQEVWESINSKTESVLPTQRIRRLTPKEAFKLMDFNFGIDGVPDFKWNVSDSQAYKQAGNSICVGVLAAIISKLKL